MKQGQIAHISLSSIEDFLDTLKNDAQKGAVDRNEVWLWSSIRTIVLGEEYIEVAHAGYISSNGGVPRMVSLNCDVPDVSKRIEYKGRKYLLFGEKVAKHYTVVTKGSVETHLGKVKFVAAELEMSTRCGILEV